MNRAERLVSLFHHRWAVPALAELHRGKGAKLVTLLTRLDASSGAMRQALDHLIELGWIRRNPGVGHPLRPEYILRGQGHRLGAAACALMTSLDTHGLRDTGLRKWSMPVLHTIGEGPRRFAEIADRVTGTTDRAIARALRDLGEASLLTREVLAGPPLATRYTPTRGGRALLPLLTAL